MVHTRRVCCGEVTKMTVVLPVSPQFACCFLQFLLGVHHRAGENMNCAFRNACMNQDLAVVLFLSDKVDSELGQFGRRTVGPAEPDFRGVALA